MSKSVVIALVSTLWILFINSEMVKRSTCGVNERHVDCGHCGPKTCEDLGHPIPCAGATARCRPECVCVDAHVRDVNGTCIPKAECPGCKGDHNATSGCGNHCGNSCSDYKDLNSTCLTGCRYNSCDCKSGYVFHDTLGKCVLPIDCFFPNIVARPCWKNEEKRGNFVGKRRNGILRSPLSQRKTCPKLFNEILYGDPAIYLIRGDTIALFKNETCFLTIVNVFLFPFNSVYLEF